MHHSHIRPGGRYPILRTIAILWLVAAVLALIAGVYQAICALANVRAQEWLDIGGMTLGGRVMAFFIWLAATFFMVIVNVAVAELIKLAIDIEHNTRTTALSTTALPAATATAPVIAAAAPVVPVSRASDGREAEEESAESALIRGR